MVRLVDAHQVRRRAISRCPNDIDRWRRVTVVGIDKQDYSHLHLGLYLDEIVDEEQFESVCRAHIENSPIAEWNAHGTGTCQIEGD